MFEILDRRTSLTGNQIKILAAAIIGDALESSTTPDRLCARLPDRPWKLTFGQSAIVLMSSGIGAIMGAYVWGWLADRIGRRKVFIGTVLNFSVATGLLYFTPDNGWIYLSLMRFSSASGSAVSIAWTCVGAGFMPSSKRGWVGGIVTCVIPLGVGLGAVIGALLGSGGLATPVRDRRAARPAGAAGPPLGAGIAALAVPPGPLRGGTSVAGLGAADGAIHAAAADGRRRRPIIKSNWLDLFKYPRSLIVSWLGNAGAQTGVYGVTLWAPSLFVLLLR